MATMNLKLNKRDEENAISNMQDNFLDRIKKVYSDCIGYEQYGDTVEFYDEDGVVLMTITQMDFGKVFFNFGGAEGFEYHEKLAAIG